jgi:hypothetical protein
LAGQGVAALALVGVTLYWSIPRKADLRAFNPAQMAGTRNGDVARLLRQALRQLVLQFLSVVAW